MIATRMNVFDGIPYKGETGCWRPLLFLRVPVIGPGEPRRSTPLPDLAEPLALIGVLQELGVSLGQCLGSATLTPARTCFVPSNIHRRTGTKRPNIH